MSITEQNTRRANIPSDLFLPPTTIVAPPIDTHQQSLPLRDLAWEDFERLCLRLAWREADVEHCQLYGTRGQEQSGIDLYGRKSGASQYTVYQCKRVRHFGPARIKAAVTTFLKGDWVGKTETLVLCTSESLVSKDRADEIEKQHERLQGSGVSLIPWDVDVLCEKLKAHPDLVHDFFGNAWVRSFVGEEAAKRLGRRLEPRQVLRLRQRLAEFYRRIFDTQDPGLPGDPGTRDEPLLLEHRFVVPDIADLRQDVLQPIQGAGLRSSGDVAYAPGDDTSSPWLDKLPREAGRGRQEIIASIRQPIPTWLARASRNVVLGLPGSGKSSLLRFLALDLLSQEPRLALFAQRWGQHIPVWIPFALWTRLIDSPQGEFRSLPDLLREWFHRWHEDALWPLVEEALRDGRLLLLVDGLDEWTSEAAAGIALDLLKSFVEQLDIPVVVTSRPHAYRQLGAQVLGWQEGELCGFTAAQQHSLAVTWFRHRELQLQAMGGAGGTTSAELAGRADARSTEFIREIQGSPDLRDLAEVPLLLALLIVFEFKGVHLPQHRFGVYAELVKHLAAVHPQRRQRAAAVSPVQGFPLGEDDFEKVLAKLAFTLHEQHGEGSIAANEAAGVIEAYLRDEDEGLGFSRREAHETAARLLETCQNTAGLLVRRTQTEVAFFHRTFGEYLAAAYIAGLPLDSRAEFVASRCADAAWREVILGLFWLTRAQEELRLYLERIEHTGLSRVQRYAADLILYEAAFGSFNCPVSDARRIAERAFECVEYDLWMPHRERVLDLVLGGLRSTRVRERVKAKITQWFPCYSARRNALYDIVSRWERSPETIECLWRGLHDEQTDNQRAAGKALLRHAGQDDEVANKVARLASDGADPMIKAAALEALLFGRPDYPELGELIEAARKSFSPELRLVAIMGKIQRAEQTEQDRKELMRLGSDFTRIDYRWRDEIPTALMRGWPGCPRILDACFQALDQRAGMHDHPIHRELAGYILLAGYAENPKVVQYCVDQLSKAEHPFIFLDHEHWKLLRDGFRDRPEIATAIDAWMENDDHRDSVMLSHAAMVCRTENAKRMLLSATDASRRMDHLTARALLEGWGMADPEVAAKLREVAFGPESEAGYIAYLLPDIIQDKVACRARLLQIFQQPECARPEFVIDGLARLGDTRGDTEVVDIALSHLLKDRESIWSNVSGYLFAHYSWDDRVKAAALGSLYEERCNWGAVAAAYGDEVRVNRAIFDVCACLPACLREVIALYLGECGDSNAEFALSVLQKYRVEAEQEVRVQASLSYHRLLDATGHDTATALAKLTDDIVARDPLIDAMRQAAYAGLAVLGRLDVVRDAQERTDSSVPFHIVHMSSRGTSAAAVRYTIENWTAATSSLGEMVIDLFSPWGRDRSNAWNEFCRFADEHEAASREALMHLEESEPSHVGANTLRFLGRIRPGSALLARYCLAAVQLAESFNLDYWDEAVVATEILGDQFNGRGDLLTQLLEGHSMDMLPGALIVTACEMATDDDTIHSMQMALAARQRRLSYTAAFHLLGRIGEQEDVVLALHRYFRDGRPWLCQIGPVARPIIRRLRRDEDLADSLMEKLQNSPNASEKASLPRLLAVGRGLTPRLREWCMAELERQLGSQAVAEVGVDVVSRQVQPVAWSLLSLVT